MLNVATNLRWMLVVTGAAVLNPAAADDFPSRPITMVVPFPGGGVADLVPRLIVDGMAATLGQPVVVDNRGGAGGTIGTTAVARAAADGYTLLMTVNPTITMNIYLQKNVPYDPRTAFAPITLAASSPMVLVVNPSLPINSIADLIDYARKNPGKLSYGTPGIGTGQHVVGELLKLKAGIDMVHVPYRGTGLMVQDVMSGQIQVGLGTPTAVLPFAPDKLRVLAVAEPQRFPDLPDVPTISETVPGVVFNAWYGMFAPAGTPKPIVDRIHDAAVKQINDPDTARKMRLQGVVPVGSTPEELGRITQAEIDRWAVDIPAIGLKPQ